MIVNYLPFSHLSDKTKFAIQASLSIVLAYILPIAYGWSTQSYTAAIAVMTIASTTRLDLAFAKGILRIVGTLIGAAIGLVLIANFAQERMLYLSVISVVVFVLLYLVRSYEGDATLFLLILITIMSLYGGENYKNIVAYAVDRISMTLFGVFVYTAVSLFVFPQKKPSEKKEKKQIKKLYKFDFLTPEHLKGAFIGFLIYWCSVAFWLYFNPPLGFVVVELATILSATTILSPITPKMVLIAFSMSLFVALVAYIGILPNLHYGWQLTLFLFLYAFLGYYLLPEELSMIYMIGTTTFYIQNTMFYDLGVFLNVLFSLYIFMFTLLFFYYIPFSSKSEDLFVTMLKRYFRLVDILVLKSNTFTGRPIYMFAKRQMEKTLESLMLWGSKIDTSYTSVEKNALDLWLKDAKQTAHDALQNKTTKQQVQQLFKQARDLGLERLNRGRF